MRFNFCVIIPKLLLIIVNGQINNSNLGKSSRSGMELTFCLYFVFLGFLRYHLDSNNFKITVQNTIGRFHNK